MRQTQLDLIKKAYKSFGGSLLKGAHARGPRPISSNHAIHIVMRSEIARGSMSMRHRSNHRRVDEIVAEQAKKWGMKIYRYANVGNHLHILVKAQSRRRFLNFLRSISGLIARSILGAERGRAKLGPKLQRFWQARPFTRIVKWGRDYIRAVQYVEMNAKEALGFFSPRQIKQYRACGGWSTG